MHGIISTLAKPHFFNLSAEFSPSFSFLPEKQKTLAGLEKNSMSIFEYLYVSPKTLTSPAWAHKQFPPQAIF